jgi:hypothetical protein
MAKKGIIYETLNEVKSMDIQKTNDGFMHLSGVFGVCGVRNNNQRVYETANYKKMVESMQERLKKAPIPGELEHPQTMNITTENISHRIDSIQIDEQGVVSGEITLLNTPKGKIAQAIVEGGLPLFISSRAQGQVDRNGNVTLEMLQTYDLVGSPGFSQAELHLNENQCYESICEGIDFIGDKVDSENVNENQNNNEDMDAEQLKQIQEQLEELKSQVEYLSEQNNLLQEQVDEKQDIDLEQLANGIQSWIVEQYSPELQNWIVEEYSQKVQDWVVENYSQEVQNWVVEHFAPEVQNWITEHYSPEVQKWVTEQFGTDMKKWVAESYSENLQKWLSEHYEPELKNQIAESLKADLNEAKNSKFNMIDSILEMLEQKQVQKPVYGRKANMVTEGNAPKYIAEMPADVRVKYDLASQDVKESIDRKAKLYDWSKENAIENFWESIDFEAQPNVNNVMEGLDKITDERERAIRESIRRWRNR